VKGGPSGGGTRVIIIRKKARSHGGSHGGSWKVAYADFVTAMMALFMVLWLLSQTDQETRQKLSEYFRTGMFAGAPSVLTGGSGVQDRAFFDVVGRSTMQPEASAFERVALAVRAQMQRIAEENPDLKQLASNVKVAVTEDGLLITILDGGNELLFDLSSSDLKPRLVQLLERLAPILARLDNNIQVHGHTDARPFPKGSGRSNWQLSFERADRAREVLEGSGLRKGQVAGVFAHGDTSLHDLNQPFAPENRRLALLAVRRGLEKVAAAPPPPPPEVAPPTKQPSEIIRLGPKEPTPQPTGN